ncbi:hypothetical protein BG005_011711 [Podila minutissima]|nr:hypothetical protein BG005_011711 [Podila minutissima]
MWSPKSKRKKGASGMEAMEADATFDQTTPVPVASATTTPGDRHTKPGSTNKITPQVPEVTKKKQRRLAAHVDDQVKEVIGMIKQLETSDETVRSTDVAMEDARQELIATAAQKPFLDDGGGHQSNNRPKGPERVVLHQNLNRVHTVDAFDLKEAILKCLKLEAVFCKSTLP